MIEVRNTDWSGESSKLIEDDPVTEEFIQALFEQDFESSFFAGKNLTVKTAQLTLRRGMNRLPLGQISLRVGKLIFEEDSYLLLPSASESFTEFKLYAAETEMMGPCGVRSRGISGDSSDDVGAPGIDQQGGTGGEGGKGGSASPAADLILDLGKCTFTGEVPSEPTGDHSNFYAFFVTTVTGTTGMGGRGGRGGRGHDASCTGSGAKTGGRGGRGGPSGDPVPGSKIDVTMSFTHPMELGFLLFRSTGSIRGSGGQGGDRGLGGRGKNCGIYKRGPGGKGKIGPRGVGAPAGVDGQIFFKHQLEKMCEIWYPAVKAGRVVRVAVVS